MGDFKPVATAVMTLTHVSRTRMILESGLDTQASHPRGSHKEVLELAE